MSISSGAPSGVTPGVVHDFDVADDSGDVSERLDLLVSRRCELSRTQAATLIATGQVTVNGNTEKASYRSLAGDRLHVVIPPPPGRDIIPENSPLDIGYEDEYLLVVNKAAGMVVHPAPGNWTGTLVNALIGRGEPLADGGSEERAGLVHRLDKDTSGLLIVAKTDVAHRSLSAALAGRKVTRRYVALCWGHFATDNITVEKPIGRDPRDRTKMTVVPDGRMSRTDFVRLGRFDSADLLRAHLHSGRTHQIRVHLSSIGHPVVGDDTYGGGGGRRLVELPGKRHFLHAAWLRFRHPITGEPVDLRSPLPADLRQSLSVVSLMPELATHQDPLEVFGFYKTDEVLPGHKPDDHDDALE